MVTAKCNVCDEIVFRHEPIKPAETFELEYKFSLVGIHKFGEHAGSLLAALGLSSSETKVEKRRRVLNLQNCARRRHAGTSLLRLSMSLVGFEMCIVYL